MATVQNGLSNYLGIKKLYNAGQPVYFGLADPGSGDPYTGGVIYNGTTGNIKITLYMPNNATHDKHGVNAPAGTITSLGGGLYRMALWGEGNSANDMDLDVFYKGHYGMRVYPVAGEFAAQYFTYDVAADMDAKLAVTYLPGTAGSDQITGCLSIFRWMVKEHLFSPLTATNRDVTQGTQVITGLTLKITDKDSSSNILSLTSTDFTENTFDGNLYFTKAITGLTGARVLTARVYFIYNGTTGAGNQQDFTFDFTIPARFAA